MFIACFNPPLFYFMFYTYTVFVYFYVKVRYVFRRPRLFVDSLSSKSSAYFEFFVQEMMFITASSLAVSFDFRQLGRRLVLLESFYVTFLVEASALYFYICIFLTERN